MDKNSFRMLCGNINDFAKSSEYVDREIKRNKIEPNNFDLVAGTNGRRHHEMWVSMKTVSHFNLGIALELLFKLILQINNVELNEDERKTHYLAKLYDLVPEKYRNQLECKYQKINRSINSKGYEHFAFTNKSFQDTPEPPSDWNISSFRGMLEYFDEDVMLWMKRYSWELIEKGKRHHYLSDISVFTKLVCEVVSEIRDQFAISANDKSS